MNFFSFSRKYFSVLPKVPKLELTLRTPYRTLFKDFSGFQRLYVNTTKGLMAISNRTPPVIYLLPPGEIKVTNLVKSHFFKIVEGNNLEGNASGEFVHSGGVVIVHDNNTVDVNVMECIEKEKFAYDKVDTSNLQSLDQADSKYDKEAANNGIKKVMKKK